MSVSARSGFEHDAGRHRAAVATTLSWADEAAASGDYRGALAWLRTVERVGDTLNDHYRAKRERWLLRLDGNGRQRR